MERTRRHKLVDIIAIAIGATICGADSWVHIELFGRSKLAWFQTFLSSGPRSPRTWPAIPIVGNDAAANVIIVANSWDGMAAAIAPHGRGGPPDPRPTARILVTRAPYAGRSVANRMVSPLREVWPTNSWPLAVDLARRLLLLQRTLRSVLGCRLIFPPA